jgi:hypothetical protein
MVDLQEFVSFAGTLTYNDRQWSLPFSAKVVESGDVQFEIPSLPYDADMADIRQICSTEKATAHRFGLVEFAQDGTSFETSSLYFNQFGIHSDQTGSTFELIAQCSTGIFGCKVVSTAYPVVRQSLRHFQCFGFLQAPSSLGLVEMRRMLHLPETDKLSGYLQITATFLPENLPAWRADVDKLLKHIISIMSFAASHNIKAPVTQTWHGDQWAAYMFFEPKSRQNSMQVFHHLNLQPIFNVAVSSYFSAPIVANNLFFAIDWFTMPAEYKEMRLVNAMTALENLTNSNLEESDKLLMPPALFDKIAKKNASFLRCSSGPDRSLFSSKPRRQDGGSKSTFV